MDPTLPSPLPRYGPLTQVDALQRLAGAAGRHVPPAVGVRPGCQGGTRRADRLLAPTDSCPLPRVTPTVLLRADLSRTQYKCNGADMLAADSWAIYVRQPVVSTASLLPWSDALGNDCSKLTRFGEDCCCCCCWCCCCYSCYCVCCCLLLLKLLLLLLLLLSLALLLVLTSSPPGCGINAETLLKVPLHNKTANELCCVCGGGWRYNESSDGTTSLAGTNSSAGCFACPGGKFSRDGVCQPCALNHWQNRSGQTSCEECAAGRTTRGRNGTAPQSSCLPCAAGRYERPGQAGVGTLGVRREREGKDAAPHSASAPAPARTATRCFTTSKLTHAFPLPLRRGLHRLRAGLLPAARRPDQLQRLLQRLELPRRRAVRARRRRDRRGRDGELLAVPRLPARQLPPLGRPLRALRARQVAVAPGVPRLRAVRRRLVHGGKARRGAQRHLARLQLFGRGGARVRRGKDDAASGFLSVFAFAPAAAPATTAAAARADVCSLFTLLRSTSAARGRTTWRRGTA